MNDDTPADEFRGYRRADGTVGTRNYLGVLIAGNCAATAARLVARHFTPERLAAYPNVDGVIPFIHELGCGMEKSGEPMDLLRRSLGGTIRNPNLVGAVVLALGCDRNNIYAFLEQEHLTPGPMLRSVVLQEVGGTREAVDQGIEAIASMLDEANRATRTRVPLAELVVGVQSQLVAHDMRAAAILDAAIDCLVDAGGTVVLSDTQRTAPALLSRDAACVAPAARDALAGRAAWWRAYTAGKDTGRSAAIGDAAPGPAYAGRRPLDAVFGYAHALPSSGLLLMDSPRHEAVTSTGLVAAGATLLCLASREASVFGANGAPTVKLAIDAAHHAAFDDDLDFDCTRFGAGGAFDAGTREAAGRALVRHWIAAAGGKPTRSEAFGVDQSAFMPWPIGVFA